MKSEIVCLFDNRLKVGDWNVTSDCCPYTSQVLLLSGKPGCTKRTGTGSVTAFSKVSQSEDGLIFCNVTPQGARPSSSEIMSNLPHDKFVSSW